MPYAWINFSWNIRSSVIEAETKLLAVLTVVNWACHITSINVDRVALDLWIIKVTLYDSCNY